MEETCSLVPYKLEELLARVDIANGGSGKPVSTLAGTAGDTSKFDTSDGAGSVVPLPPDRTADYRRPSEGTSTTSDGEGTYQGEVEGEHIRESGLAQVQDQDQDQAQAQGQAPGQPRTPRPYPSRAPELAPYHPAMLLPHIRSVSAPDAPSNSRSRPNSDVRVYPKMQPVALAMRKSSTASEPASSSVRVPYHRMRNLDPTAAINLQTRELALRAPPEPGSSFESPARSDAYPDHSHLVPMSSNPVRREGASKKRMLSHLPDTESERFPSPASREHCREAALLWPPEPQAHVGRGEATSVSPVYWQEPSHRSGTRSSARSGAYSENCPDGVTVPLYVQGSPNAERTTIDSTGAIVGMASYRTMGHSPLSHLPRSPCSAPWSSQSGQIMMERSPAEASAAEVSPVEPARHASAAQTEDGYAQISPWEYQTYGDEHCHHVFHDGNREAAQKERHGTEGQHLFQQQVEADKCPGYSIAPNSPTLKPAPRTSTPVPDSGSDLTHILQRYRSKRMSREIAMDHATPAAPANAGTSVTSTMRANMKASVTDAKSMRTSDSGGASVSPNAGTNGSPDPLHLDSAVSSPPLASTPMSWSHIKASAVKARPGHSARHTRQMSVPTCAFDVSGSRGSPLVNRPVNHGRASSSSSLAPSGLASGRASGLSSHTIEELKETQDLKEDGQRSSTAHSHHVAFDRAHSIQSRNSTRSMRSHMSNGPAMSVTTNCRRRVPRPSSSASSSSVHDSIPTNAGDLFAPLSTAGTGTSLPQTNGASPTLSLSNDPNKVSPFDAITPSTSQPETSPVPDQPHSPQSVAPERSAAHSHTNFTTRPSNRTGQVGHVRKNHMDEEEVEVLMGEMGDLGETGIWGNSEMRRPSYAANEYELSSEDGTARSSSSYSLPTSAGYMSALSFNPPTPHMGGYHVPTSEDGLEEHIEGEKERDMKGTSEIIGQGMDGVYWMNKGKHRRQLTEQPLLATPQGSEWAPVPSDSDLDDHHGPGYYDEDFGPHGISEQRIENDEVSSNSPSGAERRGVARGQAGSGAGVSEADLIAHRNMYKCLAKELSPSDLRMFETLVHGYDQGLLPLEGARGLLGRVRLLLLSDPLLSSTEPTRYALRLSLATQFEVACRSVQG